MLVLVLIDGTRELLTPGAWKKEGYTYRLADPPAAAPAKVDSEEVRRQKLQALAEALKEYARNHEGEFPPSRQVKDIPPDKWRTPADHGEPYLYVEGLRLGQRDAPLAYEPERSGSPRLVLMADGEIRLMDTIELLQLMKGGKP
jgi:hypothetical protein